MSKKKPVVAQGQASDCKRDRLWICFSIECQKPFRVESAIPNAMLLEFGGEWRALHSTPFLF